MYMSHGPQGQAQHISGSPNTLPQSLSNNNNSQGQYPFAFDPAYQGESSASTSASAAGPSGPSSSYEYSYSRTQPPIPVNIDTVQTALQPLGSSGSGWYTSGGEGSNERGTTRDSMNWPAIGPGAGQTGSHSQIQSYDITGSSSSGYQSYGMTDDHSLANGWDNGKGMTNSQWPDEYVEPSSTERELVGLRMTLGDLVESIRPYASSSSNPRPPPPSSYLQARFIRLASTIQSTLSNLQPHLHQTLHPQFNLPPPNSHRHKRSKSKHGSSPGLSSAEKEMEVIRKRRDMLIARAAQVQASSHPAAIQHSQLPANWPANHGEIYQNGAGVYSTSNNNTNNNNNSNMNINPFPLLNDNTNGNASLNSSRRSTITLENFDASLARFSLDPTKIGQNANSNGNGSSNGNGVIGGVAMEEKKPSDDGRCHGCGVSVTAEWRRGPDGPRSLCNACGLHYAKLTKRRAQEEANAAVNIPATITINDGIDFNSFPPSIQAFSVEGIM